MRSGGLGQGLWAEVAGSGAQGPPQEVNHDTPLLLWVPVRTPISVEQTRPALKSAPLGHVEPSALTRVLPPASCLLPGVDSRAALELRQSLATSIGIPLPPTLLYDYQVGAHAQQGFRDAAACD